MTKNQVVKDLNFGLLYGSPLNTKKLVEPSVVERLAALSDPVIADRVLAYDDPEAWRQKMVEKMVEKWGSAHLGDILQRYADKFRKQLEGIKDAPWVRHAKSLIAMSNVNQDPMRPNLVSVQPMTTGPSIAFYRPRYGEPVWVPSAVERLGALSDPGGELAEKIRKHDEAA